MSVELRPYFEYKDSGLPWLGRIPAHWELLRTKFLFREVNERSKAGKETHLSMSQKHGLIESSRVEVLPLQSENYAGGKLCRTNDLVLNRLKAHLGVFSRASQDGVVSSDYTVFRLVRNDQVRFFEFLFKTPLYIGELRRSTRGIVEGFWRLYTDDFYNIRAIVPPASEQQSILTWIDRFDSLVDRFVRKKGQLVELLNEQKQAIITHVVTRGVDPNACLRPSGIDSLPQVPKHWEILKLKFVVQLIVNGSTPPSDRADCWDGNIVWVTPEDISKVEVLTDSARKITETGLNSCSATLVPPDSIIVTSRAPVGNVAISKTTLCTNQGCKAIVPRHDRLDVRLGYYLFRLLQPELERLANGTTFTEISTFALANLKVPISPITEQRIIADKIESSSRLIDRAIKCIQREIELVREHRTRVIRDLATGKVDVRGAEPLPLDDSQALEPLSLETSDEPHDGGELEVIAEGLDADN